jgi:hypothetical protein
MSVSWPGLRGVAMPLDLFSRKLVLLVEDEPLIALDVEDHLRLFATPTTLLIVPCLFAKLRKGNDGRQAHGVFESGLE